MTDTHRTHTPADARKPTSLYLYFDSNGLLLYVGITKRGMARNREHDATKEWWSFVARQEVRHLPTRGSALSAERQMIEKHRPPFNVQHNPDHTATREAYLRLAAKPDGGVRDLTPFLRPAKQTRLRLTVESYGTDQLMLEADTSQWPDLDPSSVETAQVEMLGADRRGGVKVIRHAWNGKRLTILVRCRTNATECSMGHILLRMPTKENRAVTVKHITLIAGAR